MKKLICLTASLLALALAPAFGQPVTPPRPLPPPQLPRPSDSFQERLQKIVNNTSQTGDQPPGLTKFDLDFRGGSPVDLVNAIEKATGKPLNVIIRPEDARENLPPLKMNDVSVLQLFAALEATSRNIVTIRRTSFPPSYSDWSTGYGFKTADNPITDSSIWYFHVERASLPPIIPTESVTRFYSLDPYLNRGFTVDDITTAIQTGWKMSGVSPTPQLRYHKETKMLIAFGEPDKLAMIDDVLRTLPAGNWSYTDEHAVYNKLDDAQADIKKLQQKVDQLTKTNSLPANLPEEKSGK